LLSAGKELQVPIGELKAARSTVVRSSSTNEASDLVRLSNSANLAAGTGQPVTLDETQRQHILRVLRQTRWRVSGPNGAAKLLGMKRTTLQARMRKLGITRPI
jgi:formate hydrogenlyase transcriptional activator